MWSFVQFMLAAVLHDTVYRASGCLAAAAGASSITVHEWKKKNQKPPGLISIHAVLSLITLLACEAWLCPWLLKSDTLQGMSWKAVRSLLVFICEPAEKKETYCQWVSQLTHLGCSEINVLCALFWADSWKLCMNVLIIVDEAFPI